MESVFLIVYGYSDFCFYSCFKLFIFKPNFIGFASVCM